MSILDYKWGLPFTSLLFFGEPKYPDFKRYFHK